MLKYLAEWCSMMSAACFVAAFFEEKTSWMGLLISFIAIKLGVYLRYMSIKGEKNGR